VKEREGDASFCWKRRSLAGRWEGSTAEILMVWLIRRKSVEEEEIELLEEEGRGSLPNRLE